MNVARIIDGKVVGVEIAEQEWLDANKDAHPGVTFVPFADDLVVPIGAAYSPESGFDGAWIANEIVEVGFLPGVEYLELTEDEVDAILAGN